MAETSRFSLNDNSSDDRYPSGSTFPKIDLDKVLVIGLGQLGLPVAKYVTIEVDNEYRRLLALSTSHQTVGETLSSRYPDFSKSGDRETGETILEMTSIDKLVPAPAYSSNPINK